MNIATYFLAFVVFIAALIFAIKKIWESNLAENKSINLFLIIFILTTIFTFTGIGISRYLMRKTKNIMPTVGEKGDIGKRGDVGLPAMNCKCNDDTFYNKVMAHITLVYNEWSRINGYPTMSSKKYIKNKFIKNKVNMICSSNILSNLIKQNGINKFPYIDFKKGILNGKINTCDINSNCGAFDLLLETWRKWILIILKYERGKYFLDSEDLTDADFDSLITDFDKDQTALPLVNDKVQWIFKNPLIFPDPSTNYNYNELRERYISENPDGTESFNDALFEKEHITLSDLSDNVKFDEIKKKMPEKMREFYNSDFYKFYSVNGVVSVKGVNTKSPFDEIKEFDAWYWGSSPEIRPKMIEVCDSVYDDPTRKYNNIYWDIVDKRTRKSIKPNNSHKEISQWGTYKFDNYNLDLDIPVIKGRAYRLVAKNLFDCKVSDDCSSSSERWYGAKIEIKDGIDSKLLKLEYTHDKDIVFKSNKIKVRINPDFEFYDEETPKIKIKISNDYNEIWNNQNKRQIKVNTASSIEGTSLCREKNVYIPYRNKGNVFRSDGRTMEQDNRKISVMRAKEFSDKDEKELKFKYYKPLGDSIFIDNMRNKKNNSDQCRPFITDNKKEPINFRKNGPKDPTILVSGDVVKPIGYERKFIRKRLEGLHKNDYAYSFYKPIAPEGYICLGDVISNNITGKEPSLEAVRCLPKKCLEEITESKDIKRRWTTRDYRDSITLNKLNDRNHPAYDKEVYNAMLGDNQICGFGPPSNLEKFKPDSDYYVNIDNLNDSNASDGNEKDIDLFVNENTKDIGNITKDYDYEKDEQNILENYNVFKITGSRSAKKKLGISSRGRFLIINDQNQITFANDSIFNKKQREITIQPASRNGLNYVYFSKGNTKYYLRGIVDPTLTKYKWLATSYEIKDDNGKQKLYKDGKYLSYRMVNIATDKPDLRDTPLYFRQSGSEYKAFVKIEGVNFYLYENADKEIKISPSENIAALFNIRISGRNLYMDIKGETYVYSDDNILRTSNIVSGFSKPLSINTSSFPNNVVLNNFGLSIKYLNDLHLTALESNIELRKNEQPKFYRIKKQCLYDPKEYKFKTPEIKIGEKYGKEYSVLKIYD